MGAAEYSLDDVTSEMVEVVFAVLKISGIADVYLGVDK